MWKFTGERLNLDDDAGGKSGRDARPEVVPRGREAAPEQIVKLAHCPGELGRAASRLGDAGININYGYCGTEPNTNSTFLIFGVAEVGKAVKILEQAAAAAATT